MSLGLQYDDADWPHGLRCAQCHHLFRPGERYSEQLDGFTNEIPTTLIVCLNCALEPASTPEPEES